MHDRIIDEILESYPKANLIISSDKSTVLFTKYGSGFEMVYRAFISDDDVVYQDLKGVTEEMHLKEPVMV